MTSRRRFLAASAVALLAGCGEDDQTSTAGPPADALLGSLAAERALAASTAGDGRRLVRRVSMRARERAERLAAAVSAEGGRPHDVPAPAGGSGDPIALGRAALTAHIAALPSLAGRERRRLGAELVTGTAADVAVLGDELGRPVSDPFPGSGT